MLAWLSSRATGTGRDHRDRAPGRHCVGFETGSETAASATGTPQVGFLSPLLARHRPPILDAHFVTARPAMALPPAPSRGGGARGWPRSARRHSDDFAVLVAGTPGHAEVLRTETGVVLAPMGLRLLAAKTRVVRLKVLTRTARPRSGRSRRRYSRLAPL